MHPESVYCVGGGGAGGGTGEVWRLGKRLHKEEARAGCDTEVEGYVNSRI